MSEAVSATSMCATGREYCLREARKAMSTSGERVRESSRSRTPHALHGDGHVVHSEQSG